MSARHKCERHVCQYIQVISKPEVSRGEERRTKCLPQQGGAVRCTHKRRHTKADVNDDALTISVHLLGKQTNPQAARHSVCHKIFVCGSALGWTGCLSGAILRF